MNSFDKAKYYAGIAFDFTIILLLKKIILSFFYSTISEYHDFYGLKPLYPQLNNDFVFQFVFTSILAVGVFTLMYYLLDGQTIGSRLMGRRFKTKENTPISFQSSLLLALVNLLHLFSMGLTLVGSFTSKLTLEERLTMLQLVRKKDQYTNFVTQNLIHQNIFIPECPIISEAKKPADISDVEEDKKIAA